MALDWPSLLIGVGLSLIASIPVAFFVNIKTPWIQDALEKRRRRNLLQKRLPALKRELHQLESLRGMNRMVFYFSSKIILGIYWLSAMLLSISFGLLMKDEAIKIAAFSAASVFGLFQVVSIASSAETLVNISNLEIRIEEVKGLIIEIESGVQISE